MYMCCHQLVMFLYFVMVFCKKICLIIKYTYFWSYSCGTEFFVEVFPCFFIVTACRFFLAVLLLLYWNHIGIQLKRTRIPNLNHMVTFL